VRSFETPSRVRDSGEDVLFDAQKKLRKATLKEMQELSLSRRGDTQATKTAGRLVPPGGEATRRENDTGGGPN